jgi:hypothetical protein
MPSSSDFLSVPSIFDVCKPKEDVRSGTMADAEFAADLSMVLRGDAPDEYLKPAHFFANTFPTRGLRNLLANVCSRLSHGSGVACIFRLDTSYGGGKTHGLIALVHAAKSGRSVEGIEEFVERGNLPSEDVQIAAFDGENADPANGRLMEPGIRAFTPWGELAHQLGGRAGYELVKTSDIERVAPGADTLRELFGGKPTLILLDELSVYLRKISNQAYAKDQLTAFLTAIFKAVENSPNAVLVYTLAVGKDGKASDAYGAENQFIAQQMAELESVSARKATILNPTEDDETVQVLKRRLFHSIDATGAEQVVKAYLSLWQNNRESLPSDQLSPEVVETFRASYPLHPEVLATLTGKTATIANFQRVRGMLRLLARTVAELWKNRPADATSIHLHHIDPGFEPIRQEFVTRLGLSIYTPTISNDISGERGKTALAQEIDRTCYGGLPPYASYVARTIFIHSIAFPSTLQGITPDHLRFSVLAPELDVGFIDDARKRFQEKSAYLDDRPNSPLRFLTEANLTQIIERQKQLCDPGAIRDELNDRIARTYLVGEFELNKFPGTAGEVQDEVGGGKPLLILLSYDSVSIGSVVDQVPELVARIHKHVGSDERGFRKLLNNLIFVVADQGRIAEMKQAIARGLALAELVKPERSGDMAPHQQLKLREDLTKSPQQTNQAIQHCYRHILYPSPSKLSEGSELAHTAIEMTNTDQPDGQRAIIRALRDLGKLRSSLEEDKQDAPTRVRDRTPLRKGQITTLELRGEFRRNIDLPILTGDTVFTRGIQEGVKRSEYIYKYRELLCGPNDPAVHITISEEAIVYTMSYAKDHGIWPPPPLVPAMPKPSATFGSGNPTAPFISSGVTPSPPGIPFPESDPRVGTHAGSSARSFTKEGPLRQALTQLIEEARFAQVPSFSSLTVRLTELLDASRMLLVSGGAPGATIRVSLEGHYLTDAEGEFTFDFRGTIDDSLPLKDFLGPQFRAAKDKECVATFVFSFTQGLMLVGDAPEKLIEKLTQQAVGSAYVTASAEVL